MWLLKNRSSSALATVERLCDISSISLLDKGWKFLEAVIYEAEKLAREM